MQVENGKVKWFDAKKGYGYLNAEADGREVYCHASGLANPADKLLLNKGMRVTFVESAGQRGPKATNVRLVKN
jgi:CspA family cold shock protein